MTPGEPQSAVDYDDRTTAAVQTVLIEIGQISWKLQGKVCRGGRRGALATCSARPMTCRMSAPWMSIGGPSSIAGIWRTSVLHDLGVARHQEIDDDVAESAGASGAFRSHAGAAHRPDWHIARRPMPRRRGQDRCSIFPAVPLASIASPASSIRSKASDRPVCAALSRTPMYCATERPNSGSRMHLDRSTPGCGRLACAAEPFPTHVRACCP